MLHSYKISKNITLNITSLHRYYSKVLKTLAVLSPYQSFREQPSVSKGLRLLGGSPGPQGQFPDAICQWLGVRERESTIAGDGELFADPKGGITCSCGSCLSAAIPPEA